MKREANFTTVFRSWLRANPMPSAAFELKQTTKNCIAFCALKEHQSDALFAAKTRGISYKLPDDSRGIKPFDVFYLRCAKAYVVIKFPFLFVLIDIEQWRKEEKKSTRRSLTSQRALEIAFLTVKLK